MVQNWQEPWQKSGQGNWQSTLHGLRVMLRRRGRSAEDAEDLVQEAWLRWALYQRSKPVASPGAFLVRTALNLAATADRARAVRGPQVDVEDMLLADAAPSTEATVLARERLARLDVCLGQLRSKTRAVLLDVRLGGLSYAEAAQLHGISVSAVEKHVTQATAKVTRWMASWRA